MLRQIRYFQSVVRHHSFSKAAEECHISQSAISQQIQALERDLGFQLLERKNRTFELTPVGEYFYKKSLVLVADFDRMCLESVKIARAEATILRIGYLRCYGGWEFYKALEYFSKKYPEVSIQISHGSHEELYEMIRTGEIDLVFNDQRRAFSDEYVNKLLKVSDCFIEVVARNPICELPVVTAQDLKNMPCILVAPKAQRQIEMEYYQNIVGLQGEFQFVENLEEARLLVISGQGFLPIEGEGRSENLVASIKRIPLVRGTAQMTKNYCAFWKKSHSTYYVEVFAEVLKSQFE